MTILLKLLYLFMMLYGSLVVISSSSWFVVWFGFELNMVSFVVLFGSKTSIMSESMFSYFLIQVVGSIMMLFFCMMMSLVDMADLLILDSFIKKNILLGLMVWKIGGGPFFFWVPVVAEELSWVGNFVFLTWQSVSSLWIISLISFGEMSIFIIGLGSVIIGCCGGFNQLLMKKIFVYSSVAHIGWMLIISHLSFLIMMFYFFMYSILSGAFILFFINKEVNHVSYIFMNKSSDLMIMLLFMGLFSLGGMPPLLGVFPKWLGLLLLLNGGFMFVSFFLLLMGVLSLYYYLHLGYGWLMFLNYSCSWGGYEGGMSVLVVLIFGVSCFSLSYLSLMIL